MAEKEQTIREHGIGCRNAIFQMEARAIQDDRRHWSARDNLSCTNLGLSHKVEKLERLNRELLSKVSSVTARPGELNRTASISYEFDLRVFGDSLSSGLPSTNFHREQLADAIGNYVSREILNCRFFFD